MLQPLHLGAFLYHAAGVAATERCKIIPGDAIKARYRTIPASRASAVRRACLQFRFCFGEYVSRAKPQRSNRYKFSACEPIA